MMVITNVLAIGYRLITGQNRILIMNNYVRLDKYEGTMAPQYSWLYIHKSNYAFVYYNNKEVLKVDLSINKNYSVEVLNRNLPIWMSYEPGSTFKIITLAASLEEDTIDLYNDTYYDDECYDEYDDDSYYE